MVNKYPKIVNYLRKYHGPSRPVLFLMAFTVMGGGFLLLKSSAATVYVSNPPHHSACTQNNATTPYGNSYARPGQRFTAQVKMKNDGTSNFSPNYGFILVEFNGGVATNYWNASGGTLTGDITPGNTATFNLTVTTPSQPGIYGLNWAMYIVYNGILREPCVGKTIIVKNPPATTFTVNGQSSNISVTQGAALTLNWSASNGPTSCTASNGWSGAKPTSGTENHTGDTSTIGTKTYTLQCANQVGSGGAVTRSVVVSSPPPAAPAPAPTTTTTKPKATTQTPASTNSAPIAATDTSPPTAPGDFKATYNESVVDLTWQPSNDDYGVAGYELERSQDQVDWQKIGDTITGQTYTDNDVSFQTTYYYRLRALDNSGNLSDYSSIQITTGTFDPNLFTDQELVLTSDDGIMKVTIPAGALEEPAACDLRSSLHLHPDEDGFDSLTGPYELLCKVSSGNKITAFKQSVSVQAVLTEEQKSKYDEIKFYVRGEGWEEVQDVGDDNSFVLADSSDFAVMAKTKHAPLWQKIIIVLFILVVVILGGLFALSRIYQWRVKRKLEKLNQDSYNKEHGY